MVGSHLPTAQAAADAAAARVADLQQQKEQVAERLASLEQEVQHRWAMLVPSNQRIQVCMLAVDCLLRSPSP